MTSLRQVKLERAKAYILAHPDESKVEQEVGAHLSAGTIATARAILIKEGKFTPSRKSGKAAPEPKKAEEAPAEVKEEAPTVRKPAGMLDHEAMQAMADMIDKLADLDDEEIHKRLIKQCIRFAFDPKLHPDTRMSASQMWVKLRDQAKAKDLGPGVPLTFEDGVERLRDLFVACGAPMTLAAVNAAFNVEEAPDAGELPAQSDEDAQGATSATSPSGSSTPVPGDAEERGVRSLG